MKPLRSLATQSTIIRLRPLLAAGFIGVTCTLVAVAVTLYSINEFDSWLPGKILLRPAWLLQAALPCFNMGTRENPVCEGTPIHLFAFVIGLVATVLFYALLFHALPRIWRPR
jgi:hypothetical protein